MVTAMAAFAVEDMFLKAASVTYPTSQVLLLFGCGGALAFGIMALMKGERLFQPDVLSPVMRIRFLFEISGRFFYILALALAPLSSATVILQSAPIFVVLGAVLFFNERVGWRRWMAIVLGLVGVVIVISPTADSFSVYSLFALLGTIGFSGRDLASRAAPKTLSGNILGFYGFVTIAVAGIAFAPWDSDQYASVISLNVLPAIGAVVIGLVAYRALMNAMRTGEVSFVTPFRYSRLLFGVGLGIVVFGETLDTKTMVGAAIILFAGLVILKRGKAT